MTPVTQFSDRSVVGRSYRAHDVKAVWHGSYDVLIGCSSWDRRSICLTDADDLTARVGLLLLFLDVDEQGLRDAHDPCLEAAFARYCRDRVFIRERSTNLHELWRTVKAHLLEAYRTNRGPMKIFLDSSTCPRYYMLAILSFCLSEGLAAQIDVGYSEGVYPPKPVGFRGTEEITFREGEWQTVAIPGLEGSYAPDKAKFYLISLGFDGWKTLRVVSRKEPDRVSLLMPQPGFSSEYKDRTLEANRGLIEQYQIPEEQIVFAAAGDAIEAWSKLTKRRLERPDKENCFFLCSGSKPHSLALGLRAMCDGTSTVLYNRPDQHRVVDVSPNGVFWKFELVSLTVAA